MLRAYQQMNPLVKLQCCQIVNPAMLSNEVQIVHP